jgi:hypothetical protein
MIIHHKNRLYMRYLAHIFRLFGMSVTGKVIPVTVFALLFGACTKVMELGDDTGLKGFTIKSVVPADIQLGTPVIAGDTVKIPVLRGITLFPMSISAEPLISSETEQAVTGTSFSSFDDIKFDLEDIQANTFYLVAKSGLTRPYHIKLDIKNQEEGNDFKQFEITGIPQNSTFATKGYINPIKRTITIYGINAGFPLTLTAAASLSGNAYIKNQHDVTTGKELQLSFNRYGDSIMYDIEAENGDIREWKVFVKQAKEVTGTETQDILSAVSLNPAKQKVEIKSGEYQLKEFGTDNEAGKFIMAITPATAAENVYIEIVPTLTILSNSQTVGYKSGESIVFNDYGSAGGFVILDSRTGYYRNWKFVLTQSGTGDISAFRFAYSSGRDYIRIDSDATVIDNIAKQITLTVTHTGASSAYWPLIVTANGIDCSEGASVAIDPLIFNRIDDSARFSVVSANGTAATWKVSLIPPQTAALANIDSVEIRASSYPALTDRDILVSANTADIFIDLKDKNALPVRIQLYLHISDGAEFESFQNGDFMEFTSFADAVGVNIVSRSGERKTWKFQLLEKSQLHNSDFELWTNSVTPTIDPVPGIRRGWATANNVMEKGTAPVDNGANGLAAEMTTNILTFPKNLITSATLFLGYFDMSTISLDKPRSMTKFGIPFEAKPVAVAVDMKYIPGDSYQQSRLVSGSGVAAQYVLDNLDGEDRGQIWVELIHWNGAGQMNYAGEPTAGVNVLARGEYIASGRTEWTRLKIPIERRPGYEQYMPTHLVFVAASSIDGHLFKGSKGSKLTIDNFELIY